MTDLLRTAENNQLILALIVWALNLVFEYWLGKTNRVGSSSTLELIGRIILWILRKLKKG